MICPKLCRWGLTSSQEGEPVSCEHGCSWSLPRAVFRLPRADVRRKVSAYRDQTEGPVQGQLLKNKDLQAGKKDAD